MGMESPGECGGQGLLILGWAYSILTGLTGIMPERNPMSIQSDEHPSWPLRARLRMKPSPRPASCRVFPVQAPAYAASERAEYEAIRNGGWHNLGASSRHVFMDPKNIQDDHGVPFRLSYLPCHRVCFLQDAATWSCEFKSICSSACLTPATCILVFVRHGSRRPLDEPKPAKIYLPISLRYSLRLYPLAHCFCRSTCEGCDFPRGIQDAHC